MRSGARAVPNEAVEMEGGIGQKRGGERERVALVGREQLKVMSGNPNSAIYILYILSTISG